MANKIPLVIADFETSLAGAITAGATSFTLASATDDDGNALAAGMYCFTVNNGASTKQYLLGQLNGAAVTSVVSVDRRGNETAGAANAARSGSPIIISDFATIQRVADVLRGIVAADGTNPLTYDAEPTLTDRSEFATVGYVLDTVSGGTVDFDNQIITGVNAGETVAAGELLYFKTSDQEWYKTDADTVATVEGVQLAIALGSGTDGAAIAGGVQLSGVYTTTGLTTGSTYYASNTAGAVASSAGTTERVVGVALSTTKLLLTLPNIRSIRDNEKDALVGTDTPSTSNPYVNKSVAKTAGATINGATLPVPVYQNKTDNEFYACDANDTAAMKFLGFAVSNSTDGNPIQVQFTGVVTGFTGLSEGEKYYVSDTVGTISSTAGTNEVLVGIAISETELLIQKGTRRAAGVFSQADAGADETTTTTTLTVGFRPTVIRVYAASNTTGEPSKSYGTWLKGTYATTYHSDDESGATGTHANTTSYILNLYSGNGTELWQGTITGVTDTAFSIAMLQKEASPLTAYVHWEAEGEL